MLSEPIYKFNRQSDRITEFKGYNARGVRDDGEMKSMTNLSSDEYPMLSQRKPRVPLNDDVYDSARYLLSKSHVDDDGIKDALAVISKDQEGTYRCYYDGEMIEGLELSEGTQIVGINDKLCFFPERKYFAIRSKTVGDMDNNVALTDSECVIGNDTELGLVSSTITLSDKETNIDKFAVGDAVSIEIETTPECIYRHMVWSINTRDYFTIPDFSHNHNRTVDIIFFKGIRRNGKVYRESPLYTWRTETIYDTTNLTDKSEYNNAWNKLKTLAGFEELKNDPGTLSRYSGDDTYEYEYSDPDGTFAVTRGYEYLGTINYSTYDFKISNGWKAGDSPNYVGVAPVSGIVQAVTGESLTIGDNAFQDNKGNQLVDVTIKFASLSITRVAPTLDYVTEWNNRLWGCSNKDNTIYASKLGDPTNWQFYQATALDSFAAEQGSNGRWTGIGKFSTHLMFFKEDCIHKVYGNFPSEFQVVTQVCSGCEEGSSKSIVTMEDGVLYKSRRGIMGYSGGIPVLISSAFGNAKYHSAVAGTDGRKYYVSMLDKEGVSHLFAYDQELQTWHKEDNLNVRDFEWHDGRLCYVDHGDKIMCMDVGDFDSELEWMAEFGPFDEYIEEQKIYSVLKFRYKLDEGATLKIEIATDEGEYETMEEVATSDEQTGYSEITPRRCDRFSIRMSGTGRCIVKTLTREFRQGSVMKENY